MQMAIMKKLQRYFTVNVKKDLDKHCAHPEQTEEAA